MDDLLHVVVEHDPSVIAKMFVLLDSLTHRRKKMSEMIVRVLPKRDVQKRIKALRDAGLTVNKKGPIYECRLDDMMLFTAMNGRNGYLVRMREDLFE